MPGVRAIDVHQHLWPDQVLTLLEGRSEAPCARWDNGRWTIDLVGEPAFAVDPAEHDPDTRSGEVAADGLDGAIVALSSPIGIEGLPLDQAEPLIDAWHDAASELPDALEWWASLPLADPDPRRVEEALDRGATGLVLPAAAIATADGLATLAPVLAVLESRLAPLFVHPGPATAGRPGDAPWWSPSTAYVAELHAAWHAFAAWGRPAHPRLHVLFAALAGLAPLHAERTAGRGGPAAAEPDPLVFYDASSYGASALRAMACRVGPAQIVHGTDRPVIAVPTTRPLGHDAHEAMRTHNAARLLGRAWVAA